MLWAMAGAGNVAATLAVTPARGKKLRRSMASFPPSIKGRLVRRLITRQRSTREHTLPVDSIFIQPIEGGNEGRVRRGGFATWGAVVGWHALAHWSNELWQQQV